MADPIEPRTDVQWHCPLCETWNSAQAVTCEACGEERPEGVGTRTVARPPVAEVPAPAPPRSSEPEPGLGSTGASAPSATTPLSSGADQAVGEAAAERRLRWWLPPLVAVIVVLLVLLGIEIGVLISNSAGP